MNGFWKKSPATVVAVVLILCAASAALATSGVPTLVTSRDEGAGTARGAQQPLGSLSATPPAGVTPPDGGVRGDDKGSGGGGGQPGGGGGQPGGGEAPDDGEVLDRPPTSSPESPAAGDSAAGPAPSGSSGAASLPFTGFLAIPVLLLGTGLLLTGVAMRRRSAALGA